MLFNTETKYNRSELLNDTNILKYFDPLLSLEPHYTKLSYANITSSPVNNRSGFGRRIEITSCDGFDQRMTSGQINGLIRDILYDNMYAVCNQLGDLSSLIADYTSNIRSDSLKPCLIDQLNIKNCLEFYGPDLIIEIGGGVSSVTFSRYAQKNSCNYLMIDPSSEWAFNTLRGLSSIGMQLPIFIDLPEIIKVRTDHPLCGNISLNDNLHSSEQDREVYDFDYNNHILIESLKNSQKCFIYIDGNSDRAPYQGAFIMFDSLIDNLLTDALISIDYRKYATAACMLHPKLECLTNTQTQLIVDGNDFSVPIRKYGSALFSRGIHSNKKVINTFHTPI